MEHVRATRQRSCDKPPAGSKRRQWPESPRGNYQAAGSTTSLIPDNTTGRLGRASKSRPRAGEAYVCTRQDVLTAHASALEWRPKDDVVHVWDIETWYQAAPDVRQSGTDRSVRLLPRDLC